MPRPLDVESTEGLLFNRGLRRIGPEGRLIVRSPALRDVARGLDETLWALTDLDLGVVTTSTRMDAGEGDIVLALDPALDGEEYGLEIGDAVSLTGGSPEAVAWAVASLIQLGSYDAGRASFPRVRIRDRPRFPYRALMVDVARRPYSVEELRELVAMAHLYKVRYVHLHLTDDHAFTLPLSTLDVGRPWRSYRPGELQALDSFAATRGVVLVPEVHLPGGARALADAQPDVFGLTDRAANPRTVHMARPEVYGAVDSIIGEVARTFPRSPFIHIGGGPVSLRGFDDEETRDFLQSRGLDGVEDLPAYFAARVAEMVRRRGKQPLIWDGTATDHGVPGGAAVMVRGQGSRGPAWLADRGAGVINASPRPLDLTWDRRASPDELAAWTPYRWDHWSPTASIHGGRAVGEETEVLGGHLAVWGQDGFLAVPGARSRLPRLAETLWNGQEPTGADRARFDRVDELVMRVLRPARLRVHGRLDPAYDGNDVNGRDRFADTVRIEAAPWIPGDRILVTLDGSDPGEGAGYLDHPVRISRSGPVRLRVVDRTGRQRGFSWLRYFERRPIDAHIDRPAYGGAEAARTDMFVDSARVLLRRLSREGEVRYTVDGSEPGPSDSLYRRPIPLDATTRIRARLFDDRGHGVGDPADHTWVRIQSRDHLAVNRHVTTHPGDPWAEAAAFATDGLLDRERHWVADPAAGNAWIQVDLGRAARLGGVRVHGSWDGVTAYRYRVSGSRDGRTWFPLVDRSANDSVATEAGYEDLLESPVARWIRLEALPGTDLEPLRLVELGVLAVPTVRADGS